MVAFGWETESRRRWADAFNPSRSCSEEALFAGGLSNSEKRGISA